IDPEKLEIAARLRRETTLTIKYIAAIVHLGSSKSANANLHARRGETASEKRPRRNTQIIRPHQTMGCPGIDPFDVPSQQPVTPPTTLLSQWNNDPNLDMTIVCHSQGCNIAMHVLQRGC